MPNFKVLFKKDLTEDTFILRTERPGKTIKPGQCFSLGTSDLGINREYSMYSAGDDAYLDFLIRKIPNGRVSTALDQLGEGDDVQISGPYGEFCLPKEVATKYLFIASGTGIAPFHSFVKSYPELDYTLLHGIRFQNEEYEKEDYIDSRYISCVSRPSNGMNPIRVTDYLKNSQFSPELTVYLCGNRAMIIDSIAILRSQGFVGDSIFTETFF